MLSGYAGFTPRRQAVQDSVGFIKLIFWFSCLALWAIFLGWRRPRTESHGFSVFYSPQAFALLFRLCASTRSAIERESVFTGFQIGEFREWMRLLAATAIFILTIGRHVLSLLRVQNLLARLIGLQPAGPFSIVPQEAFYA